MPFQDPAVQMHELVPALRVVPVGHSHVEVTLTHCRLVYPVTLVVGAEHSQLDDAEFQVVTTGQMQELEPLS